MAGPVLGPSYHLVLSQYWPSIGPIVKCYVRSTKLVYKISGDTSLKDELRPGRSINFDDEALKSLVECNW